MKKEAVHVTTKEEQDYVSMKLHNETYEFRWNYVTNDHKLHETEDHVIELGYKIISFNEFKTRYELKIGDTFEHNGFVCRVEREVEKWYYNPGSKAFFKSSYNKPLDCEEITNKEFIKQLEENAR